MLPQNPSPSQPDPGPSDLPRRPGSPSRRAVLTAGPALGVLGALGAAAPASATPRHHARHQHASQRCGRHRIRRIASVAYVEVNSNDLIRVGDYRLEGSGAPAFDIANIFAANFHRDGTHTVLHLNDRVQWALDHAAQQIRPLQKRGIKVVLSILGDHQGVGPANFTSRASADRFARQVAAVVRRYGLDGVDLDDEWAEYGKDGTPEVNDHSFVDLVGALRHRLGRGKLITFYAIGPSYEHTVHGRKRAGDQLDYAWNPYYGSWQEVEVPGMTRRQLGPGAIDVHTTSTARISELARRTAEEKWGAMIAYDLGADDSTAAVSAMTKELYGKAAVRKR